MDWRIGDFLVSKALTTFLRDALIYSGVMGSGHCPVGLALQI